MSKRLFPSALVGAALLTAGLTPAQAGFDGAAASPARPVHYVPQHAAPAPGQDAARRARLGVAVSGLTQADLDDMAQEYGVRVEQVMPGSVAERAGVRPGDVVTAVDERPAYSPERLQHLVNVASDRATLSLVRNGTALRLSVVFAQADAAASGGRAMLGIRIQEMTEGLKEAFGTPGDLGVLISEVQDGSAADQAGLRAGDVLINIGHRDIARVPDVLDALSGHAPGDTLAVTLLRDGSQTRVEVALTGASGGPAAETPRTPYRHGHRQEYGHWHGHGHHGHGPHGMHKPGYGCRQGSLPYGS